MPYRLILADDHALLRQGLRMIIEQEPDLVVAGEAEDGFALLRLLEKTAADLLVLDLTMPGCGGIAALPAIKKSHPRLKTLILTMHEDPEYFHEAVRLGVDGYLLKQETDTELFSAIHAIRSGGRFLSPFLERKLAQDLMALCRTREPSGFEALTRREKQILKFVVEGASSRKIAEHLHISPRTVERHRENIMRKLRVPDVVALVKLALQKGLV